MADKTLLNTSNHSDLPTNKKNNPSIASKITVINEELANSNRVSGIEENLDNTQAPGNLSPINSRETDNSNDSTTFNELLEEQLSDLAGTPILAGKYIIGEKLCKSQESGEADLYFAETTDNSDSRKFVAKIYRRISTKILDKFKVIKNISSPYVAKIYDCTIWNKRQLIVLPYYSKGSLTNQKITDMSELRKIIKQINEGIHVLHKVGIIHKDIKPSNLMIQDNGDIAIIDFGISSILAENTTISKTRLGLTPQYAALETLVGGNFIKESDYYSFGIVLYELYTGHTPFAGETEAENSSFQLLQHLPFPKDMPTELVNLIKGLTYKDISNRHDKTNPNRRWTYQEVNNWLEGKSLPIPGYSKTMQKNIVAENLELPAGTYAFKHPYRMGGALYNNSLDLVDALAQNWENGKKHLYRGMLNNFCQREGLTKLEKCCKEAETQFNQGLDGDKVFCSFLYRFDPNFTDLVWKNDSFRNLTELSGTYLNNLYNQNDSMRNYIYELLDFKILSLYVSSVAPNDKELAEIIGIMEKQYENATLLQKSVKSALDVRITLAYAFAPSKYFKFEGKTFHNYQDLNKFFYNARKSSLKKYQELRALFEENSNQSKFKIWQKTLAN